MPRYQARELGRSPAPGRCGTCLFIPRTLIFRGGYPSPSRRCESRRNSLPRTARHDLCIHEELRSLCLFRTTSHQVRACYPFATRALRPAEISCGRPRVREPSPGRNARDVFVEVEPPPERSVGGVGAGTLSTKEGPMGNSRATSYLTCRSHGWLRR